MGFRTDVRDMLSDFVILLEKQVEGYERTKLQEFVEYIGTKSDRNLPDLILGADMRTVFFKFSAGKTEKVTAENIRPCMDYIAFLKTEARDDSDLSIKTVTKFEKEAM